MTTAVLSRLSRPRFRKPTIRIARYRSATVFWIATVIVGIVTAKVVSRSAQPYPPTWGTVAPVAVLIRSVNEGATITPADVAIRNVPSAFVPEKSARSVSAAVGRRAAHQLRAGSPVDFDHTTPGLASALAGSVGQDRRGVALSLDGVPVGLTFGDLVEVFVNRDGDGQLLITVTNARVVRTTDHQILVSVTTSEAKQLAQALSNGRATLALVGQ
jgi:Flp pilus assembly protein CpaB